MSSAAEGRFTENIVHFARALRRAGIAIGPATVVDAIRAVEVAGVAARDDFYWTLHAVFVTRRDQHAVFDEAFRLFWRSRNSFRQMLSPVTDEAEPEEAPVSRPAARRVMEALFAAEPPAQSHRRDDVEIDARLTASGTEALRRRDFAQMSVAEMSAALRAIGRMHMPEERIRSRRLVPSGAPGAIDARRMLRASLRTGGRLILLKHRHSREFLAPVVVLADISGSMGPYARLFLHFIHALGRTRRVHSFLFGTRLTNVTRELRHRDVDEALAACSEAVPDWSGGTRIGATLREFNRKWSRRVLGQGAIVLLFTDGLERETSDDLAAEMDRLHRSCRRLIWLNPLLSYPGFAAKAHGIRQMLPHVDEFRPIHSLDSIADLCRALAGEAGKAGGPRRWLQAA